MTDLDPWTDPDIAANNRAAEAGHGYRGVVWTDLFPREHRTPTSDGTESVRRNDDGSITILKPGLYKIGHPEAHHG